jgi:hypothetical protein
MWLIDVNTLKLYEFMGSQLLQVEYAILSHTWGEEEVTFQDMEHLNKTVRSKKGFPKILHAAKRAKEDGLNWVWVDTCCIDKRSSAELSEAINSMYMWYHRSSICYAYLVDVDSQPPVENDATMFVQSRWFTRGWTLQELIAPRQVTFYAKDWVRIGEKLLALPSASIVPNMLWGEKGKSALCRASGIPRALLFEGRPKEQYSVAQRMSWASKRACTRVEDTAYCLLGLFGINMPLLYGEEEGAFVRLQEEIIKATDDHSIYAWTIPHDVLRGPGITEPHLGWTPHPILASSPRYFLKGGNLVVTRGEEGTLSGLTKHGLRIQLELESSPLSIPAYACQGLGAAQMFWAPLNCRLRYQTRPLGLVLVPIKPPNSSNVGQVHFYRLGATGHLASHVGGWDSLDNIDDAPAGCPTTVYIRQKIDWSDLMATRSVAILQFRNVQVKIPRAVAQAKSHDLVFMPGREMAANGLSSFTVTVVSAKTELHWSRTFDSVGLTSNDATPHLFMLRREGLEDGLLLGVQQTYSFEKRINVATAVVKLEAGGKWGRLRDVVDGSSFEYHEHILFPSVLLDVMLGRITLRVILDCVEHSTSSVSRRIFTVSFSFED